MPVIDQREAPIEIGPLVGGAYCFIAPKAKPLVSRGPEGEDWYLSVVGMGTRGKLRGIAGWFPVRKFAEKADAVCLHDMLEAGTCRWLDATEVPIRDGKRKIIYAARLIV